MTEGPSNPILHRQIHPGVRFLILIGLLILMLMIGTGIGVVIIESKYGTTTLMDIMKLNLSVPHADTALWILQFTGTTFPILITPIIFSYFIVHEPDDYMKNHFHYPWMLMVLVFLIMAAAQVAIDYLGDINAKMVLPKALKGLEDWMKDSENEAQKMSDVMMQMNTFWGMIYDLLFIGLLTAIVEEILFRGCMQTIFIRWWKNPHVAVWVTAILFSAFHMEFYGFLPRLFLGVLFGYFTVWSGSIWPAIWAHFINNGSIVVWEYLYQNKLTRVNPDAQQVFTNTAYAISFVITVILLFIYWYISDKWHKAHNGEELDQDLYVH